MIAADMNIGKRYIVTKASDDTTFMVGDHVWPHTDGSICCREAGGWIDAQDVTDASIGAEFELDQEWSAREKSRLLAKMAKIEQ